MILSPGCSDQHTAAPWLVNGIWETRFPAPLSNPECPFVLGTLSDEATEGAIEKANLAVLRYPCHPHPQVGPRGDNLN